MSIITSVDADTTNAAPMRNVNPQRRVTAMSRVTVPIANFVDMIYDPAGSRAMEDISDRLTSRAVRYESCKIENRTLV